MLIHNFLENSAAQYPDKVAVIQDDKRVTYSNLCSQANNLAIHLIENGLKKGDRVVLIIENNIDYIVSYYAALKSGAVIVPLNPGLKPSGLKYLLNDLEAAVIITSFKAERLLKALDINDFTLRLLIIKSPKQHWRHTSFKVLTLEECLTPPSTVAFQKGIPEIDQKELASIIYTSGSSGEPKGVMLSHENIVHNSQSICKYLRITHTDIQMVVLPFFYVMGKSLLNTHIAAGGTLVINNRLMYPADVVTQIIKERVTSFSGVPSTYAYLINRSPLSKSKDSLTSLRYCSQAGGHMASSLKKALRVALPKHTQIYIMYGATEAAARLTYLEPNYFDSKMDSVGKAIPGVTVRILNKEGNEVPNGNEGELVGQGTNIMLGYWNDLNATKQVLDKHGYHTGDIGYRDRDGFIYVLRRKDGLLKVGGHRINPVEVEDFLLSTDLLIETTVIGMPDNILGNKLVALVVPKSKPCDPSILKRKCAEGLPNHKRPSDFVTIRILPKKANGKIDYEQCKKIVLAQNKY